MERSFYYGKLNGSAVATWGLSSGSSGTDSLETLNGDLVDFSFTGGNWDSEITFQILFQR